MSKQTLLKRISCAVFISLLLLTLTSCGSKGASGSKGPQGPKGNSGSTGKKGADGLPGADGQNGSQGAKGSSGAQGSNGAQGADAPTTTAAPASGPASTQYLIKSDELIDSLIELPSSNVSGGSSTIASKYLYGRTALYDLDSVKVGTFSVSFILIQNPDGIYADVTSSLVASNDIVFNWHTDESIVNLELSSIVESIKASRPLVIESNVSSNVYFGQKYNLLFSGTGNDIVFNINRRS